MNNLKFRFTLFAVIFFCLQIGCKDSFSPVSFVKVETNRTKLINGIESYQSVEEFKAFLNRSKIKWKVTADQRNAPNDKRPPFNIYEIAIINYTHIGFSGELYITFFNDRLSDTIFYPFAWNQYLEALATDEGIKFNDNGEFQAIPYTRITFAVDYKGKKYVSWKDSRLENEITIWIDRYS